MKTAIFALLLFIGNFCGVLAQKQEVTNITYEKFNDSLKVWEMQGVKNITNKSFDADGRVVKLTVAYGQIQNYELSHEFDSKGRKIKTSIKIASTYISKLYYKGDEEWLYYEDSDKLLTYTSHDFDFNRNQRIKRREINNEYDTQKRLISVTESSLPESRFKAGELELTITKRVRYTYDEKNRVISTENESYYSGISSGKTELFYGQNGKVVKQLFYYRVSIPGNWRLSGSTESEYDNQGNTILTKDFFSLYDDNIGRDSLFLIRKQELAYNSKGKNTLIKDFQVNGTISKDPPILTRKQEFEYDSKDNNISGKNFQIIDTLSKDSLILISKYESQFDSRGNIIQAKYYSIEFSRAKDSLVLAGKQELQFDDKNREIFRQLSYFNLSLKRLVIDSQVTSEFNNDDLLSKIEFIYFFRPLSPNNAGIDSVTVSSNVTYAQYYPNKKPKEYLSEARYKKINEKETLEISRTRYEYETSNSAEEIDVFKNYIVFPNPATDKIMVANTFSDDCLESVALCDITGRSIINLNRIDTPHCAWEIDLPPTLQMGMYVLFMTAYNGKTTGRQVFISR